MTAHEAAARIGQIHTSMGRSVYAIVGSYQALETVLADTLSLGGRPAVLLGAQLLARMPEGTLDRFERLEANLGHKIKAELQAAYEATVEEALGDADIAVFADLEWAVVSGVSLGWVRNVAANGKTAVYLVPGVCDNGIVRAYDRGDGHGVVVLQDALEAGHIWEVE